MKKTITFLSLAFGLFTSKAQTTVADFEGLTLGTDTFYENHSGAPWQTSNATFRYFWDATYSLWDAGFAYTNKNNTTNGTYTNLYGAVTGKGYNNSNNYVAASQGYVGDPMRIKLAATEKSVEGFFVTNSTYGANVMKHGGGPARAFGDTLNTHSGVKPGDFPDWFKLTVYGYSNGIKKTDTVEFYLADYRFTDNSKDYIVKTWQWVDCSPLGAVDSISFKLSSSDVGQYGINNPTYFCLDNFTTSSVVISGIASNTTSAEISAYPNPFSSSVILTESAGREIRVKDISGKTVYMTNAVSDRETLDLAALQSGIYFLEVASGGQKTIKKLIKH